MSRFADPAATARLVLGECQCPGTPHDEDWVDLRSELGAQDVLRMATGNSLDTLELLIVGWNLHDNDGTTAVVDRDHIERLYADTFDNLDSFIAEHVRLGTQLPNAPGARSRTGSRASASRTQKTRTTT
jgi:hypothetical protein